MTTTTARHGAGRLVATLALALTALCATAQVKCHVEGTATPASLSVSVKNLCRPDEKALTFAVNEGHFAFDWTSPVGDVVQVTDDATRDVAFFVADGASVTLNMADSKASGSPATQQLSELAGRILACETVAQLSTVALDAIATHGDATPGAFALGQAYRFMAYDDLKRTLASHPALAQNPLSAGAARQLELLALRAPGTKFKDLEENGLDGQPHRLSEYVGKGQWVLVDFWASWCGPCMMEMPNVKACYEKYHEAGFNVVGLSFDRSADAWKQCVEKNGLQWVHLSDLKFWQSVAAKTYGIRSIPSSLLCDPEGTIVAVDLRGEALGSKLADIFGF